MWKSEWMQERTHSSTHTQSKALKPQVLREFCLEGLNSLLISLSHFSTSSFSLFLFHPFSAYFTSFHSLTSLKQLLWSFPFSTFLKYLLISLGSLYLWPLFHLFLLVFYPLPCLDTNFHTSPGECQECVHSCSIMLLLHIWLQPQNLSSVSVFPEPMDGQMDGCRQRMIDEEVGQCWPSP